MIRTAAVLAGGLATRMGPLTRDRPKALLNVAGRPFVEHQLQILRAQLVERVVFCVGHFGQQLESHVGDGSAFGIAAEYVYDGPQLLGTGGALRRALPHLGSSFFVLYGDSYLECDYQAVGAAFLDSGAHGLMTVYHNAGRWDASNVLFHAGRILKYDKTDRDPAMRHIDYGLGVFAAAAFAQYEAGRRFDLAVVYRDLLAAGKLAACEVRERFYEIGSIPGLADADTYLRTKEGL